MIPASPTLGWVNHGGEFSFPVLRITARVIDEDVAMMCLPCGRQGFVFYLIYTLYGVGRSRLVTIHMNGSMGGFLMRAMDGGRT